MEWFSKTNIAMVFVQVQHKMLLLVTAAVSKLFSPLFQAHLVQLIKGFISSGVLETEHINTWTG